MQFSDLNLPPRMHPIFSGIEDFTLLHQIGAGGFSSVFLCEHKATGRKYAVKRVDLSQLCDFNADNVEHEIRAQQSFDHRHVLKLVDFFGEGQLVFLVLELCENGALFQYIAKCGPPPMAELRRLFAQALEGVMYIHQQGYIVRDLKSENLLLDWQLNVKICDFGWCVGLDEVSGYRRSRAGTYYYMSPESLDSEFQDEKSDVWSMGVLLFELLAEKDPFPGTNYSEMKELIAKGIPEYPPGKNIPESAKRLVAQMLRMDPRERPSLQEVLNSDFIQGREEQSLPTLEFGKPKVKIVASRPSVAAEKQEKETPQPLAGDADPSNAPQVTSRIRELAESTGCTIRVLSRSKGTREPSDKKEVLPPPVQISRPLNPSTAQHLNPSPLVDSSPSSRPTPSGANRPRRNTRLSYFEPLGFTPKSAGLGGVSQGFSAQAESVMTRLDPIPESILLSTSSPAQPTVLESKAPACFEKKSSVSRPPTDPRLESPPPSRRPPLRLEFGSPQPQKYEAKFDLKVSPMTRDVLQKLSPRRREELEGSRVVRIPFTLNLAVAQRQNFASSCEPKIQETQGTPLKAEPSPSKPQATPAPSGVRITSGSFMPSEPQAPSRSPLHSESLVPSRSPIPSGSFIPSSATGVTVITKPSVPSSSIAPPNPEGRNHPPTKLQMASNESSSSHQRVAYSPPPEPNPVHQRFQPSPSTPRKAPFASQEPSFTRTAASPPRRIKLDTFFTNPKNELNPLADPSSTGRQDRASEGFVAQDRKPAAFALNPDSKPLFENLSQKGGSFDIPTPQLSRFPSNQLVKLSTSHSVNTSTSQLVNAMTSPLNSITSQTINVTTAQALNSTTSQTIKVTTPQPLNSITSQTNNPIISQPFNPFTSQPNNPSTPQQLNSSTAQQLNGSTAQQLNGSTAQQLNGSTAQPTKYQVSKKEAIIPKSQASNSRPITLSLDWTPSHLHRPEFPFTELSTFNRNHLNLPQTHYAPYKSPQGIAQPRHLFAPKNHSKFPQQN